MKFIPKSLVETADVSRGKPTLKDFLKSTLSVVLVLAGLYLLVVLLAEAVVRTMPDSWERRLSGAVVATASGHAENLERANVILGRLTEGGSLRDLEYTVFILDLEEPNAVAVPGGGIGLTPALFETVESEIGLAFVLAHELGHHQHRDILRSLGHRLLLGLVATFLLNYEGLSPVDAAFDLAEIGYSRRQERAADAFALRLLHDKYGRTSGALEFLEKLQTRGHDRIWEKYAGSHPLTRDRLENLRALERQLNLSEPGRAR
jgi:predicted Zn-dependent protease